VLPVERTEGNTVDHTKRDGHQRQETVYVLAGRTGLERDTEPTDATAARTERPDAAQSGARAADVAGISAAARETDGRRTETAAVCVTPSPAPAAAEQGAHPLDAKTGANPTRSAGTVDPKQQNGTTTPSPRRRSGKRYFLPKRPFSGSIKRENREQNRRCTVCRHV